VTINEELEIDHVPVRSGGHVRHLVFVSDLTYDQRTGDGFVTDANGKVAWATTIEGASRICAAAGHEVESYIFDQAVYDEDPALELDGLLAAITSPLKPSMADRIFEAWQFFDCVAETVGETLHQDESIYDRLAKATGIEDGFIVSSLKKPWRRAQAWTDLDIEAMRRLVRSGLEMLAQNIAPAPSA
jgi:hypothetical protein